MDEGWCPVVPVAAALGLLGFVLALCHHRTHGAEQGAEVLRRDGATGQGGAAAGCCCMGHGLPSAACGVGQVTGVLLSRMSNVVSMVYRACRSGKLGQLSEWKGWQEQSITVVQPAHFLATLMFLGDLSEISRQFDIACGRKQ